MKTPIRVAGALLIALILVALFLKNTDLHQVWQEIRRADHGLLLVALGSTALTYPLRALRWQSLLRPVGPTRFITAFRTTIIGFAASFLLPARAGEVIRPYLLARREGLSVTATFATILFERLLDVASVLGLFAIFLAFFDTDRAGGSGQMFQAIKVGAAIAAAIALVALVMLFLLAGDPSALERRLHSFERRLPQRIVRAMGKVVRLFADGLAVARQPLSLIKAVALSVPLWLSIALGTWAATRAFHIEMPFSGSFLLLMLLTVGVAVPTPGAVGGFHYAYLLGVTTFYAAPTDGAAGSAIVLHAISFVPVTLLGMVFIAQDGLKLSRMGSLGGAVAAKGELGEVPVLRPSRR